MRNIRVLVLLLGWCSIPAWAIDGVIEINQTRAIAGGVTAGDTPGFPVTISQPGSYRLTSNLTVAAGADAIRISASNVTLDLNGFTIIGPGVFPSAKGVVGDDQSGIRIENGAVIGFSTGLTFLGGSEYITLKSLRVDADTTATGGTNVSGVAMQVGRTKAARAILREVQAKGQLQLTCPSLILDTVVTGGGIVEMTIPNGQTSLSFPIVCKGANVVTG